jgi:GH18 family chitinase
MNITLIMCYLDGVWDSTVKSIGPYAFAHTNLTEIQLGLELLWRNNINPARVVMGLGFYGRSISSLFLSFTPIANNILSIHDEGSQLHACRL